VGGILFLDEIGDLAPEIQMNLLRFLQEGTIERIGERRPIPVDVRVLAATHVDLERAVAQGRFREDLYHRINVLRLRMPPLRKRGTDVILLARFFLERYSTEVRYPVRGLT
jgi:DNA-binding NtrC family response regulator